MMKSEFLLHEKKSTEFRLGYQSYIRPYYQSNYATEYFEKAFSENPQYKTACNFDNAFNLDEETRDQGRKRQLLRLITSLRQTINIILLILCFFHRIKMPII
jgi:hypothetical protein